ncbi:nucleotidyl transferase AbiEii/AbiGii toxin family protein [uncultured Adlercreutzia sp.]|uniref:nucleotidyl transferase AbiEii/AbiGii toxin family protein n=1 Tax=uncultured Adlercreutzia sp. TaxID=875803 RepID=UPI0026F3D47B|nr:nucleotidyl transferase AbiEii/AbiGii toxin family protein [uncultured Adlercreutzia sp.]
MKTNNAMQLKAVIKRRATEAGVSPQLMLQNYMLERLIDRISRSPWRDSIIVKGGMLIGSLIGVDRRSTKDLDTTIRNFSLSHRKAEEVFGGICDIEVDDDITFTFVRTEDICDTDEYPGIRVFLKASYAPMSVPLKVDITTGDAIVPEAITYEYPFAFDEGSARILAYPLETIFAEKLETVLTRSTANTRPRDYYDIYELWHIRGNECDIALMREALTATCEKRGSLDLIQDYREILDSVKASNIMTRRWDSYTADHSYASGISFASACEAAATIMALLLRQPLASPTQTQ